MAREPNNPSGGGASGDDGAGAAGEGVKPNAPTGAQSGGEGGGASPEGGAGKSLEFLPPELKGKSEAELKFILGNMVNSVKTSNDRIKKLERELQNKQSEPPKDPEPKEPKKPYEERILDDPAGVIEEIVQERYGGVINTLDKRTARSELAIARQELEEFGEYEEEVMDILEEGGIPKTFENIAGAYTMAVGQKALEEKKQARRVAQGMEEGGGQPPEDGDKAPELTDLEREVARAQNMSDEEWVAAKNMDTFATIRVPTGVRKEE